MKSVSVPLPMTPVQSAASNDVAGENAVFRGDLQTTIRLKLGTAPVRFLSLAVLCTMLVLSCRKAPDAAELEESTPEPALPAEIAAILDKAKAAEANGGVAFFGFHCGMSRADADTLAAHYGIENGERSFAGDPVHSIHISLRGVRRITKGGNSYEDLCASVTNAVKNMRLRKNAADGRSEEWLEYRTIDGVRVTMAETYLPNARISTAFMLADTRNQRFRAEEEMERAAYDGLLGWMVPIPGKDYRIGRYEVTQAQWECLMGGNPSKHEGGDLPVESFEPEDRRAFLGILNALPTIKEAGFVFRLPTLDEWEYAARSGGTGRYCEMMDGTEITRETLGEVAWFSDNSGGTTHPVGQKQPNAFGLYDMFGNVFEICQSRKSDGAARPARPVGRSEKGDESVCWKGGCFGWGNLDREIWSSGGGASDRGVGFRLLASTRPDLPLKPVERLIASLIAIPGRQFRMSRYEVTQSLWASVMGTYCNPSRHLGPDNPVDSVSWDESQQFVKKLNRTPAVQAAGLIFRLPTDDEWEYACRAGTSGQFCRLSNGTEISEATLGRVAWFADNSNRKTHSVGLKAPNAFGLYDMLGNVWEWTQSATDDGTNRVYLGGSSFQMSTRCEASTRFAATTDTRYTDLGFRLCAETENEFRARTEATEAERDSSEELARTARENAVLDLIRNMVPIPNQSFRLGKFEVTQAQWEAVMGENPSWFKGANRPVEHFLVDDSQEFLLKLNALPAVKKSGLVFRLPTDKEWNSSAPSIDFYSFSAWFSTNSGARTHLVGLLDANDFGLHDMFGNVSELLDVETGSGYSIGGNWASSKDSFGRFGRNRDIVWNCYGDSSLGIRLCSDTNGIPQECPEEAPESSEAVRIARQKALSALVQNMIPIPGKMFRMGKYEVTQAQWEAVMGENPSRFKRSSRPVEEVSWFECQTFLAKLNELAIVKSSGLVFRLPTEDEWEFACRAGASKGAFKFADGTEDWDTADEVGWTAGNSAKTTHSVGQKKPNAFGLYDMLGNVWEWTLTGNENGRVVRGGGWSHPEKHWWYLPRTCISPSKRRAFLGVRLCAETEAEVHARERGRREREESARMAQDQRVRELIQNMIPIPGKTFRIGKYEVTQAQWEAIMADNPSSFPGPDHPVETVSWVSCQEFIRRLNALPPVTKAGLFFRLPTEEEWMYSCRAGVSGPGPYCKDADGTIINEDSIETLAWFSSNAKGTTHPVGQKKPNAFGLYDMFGNVAEWTQPNEGGQRPFQVFGCGWRDDLRSPYQIINSHSDPLDLCGLRLCADERTDSSGSK